MKENYAKVEFLDEKKEVVNPWHVTETRRDPNTGELTTGETKEIENNKEK